MVRATTPRSCLQCGRPFAARVDMIQRGYGLYCSRPCDWAHRKARPHKSHYLKRRDPSHPLAGVTGNVSEHRAVLYDQIGPGSHRCHWCNRVVTWKVNGRGMDALIPDHIDRNGLNNDPANLVPSCVSCNSHRSRLAGPIRDDEVVAPGKGRERGIKRLCEICGTEFVTRLSSVRRGEGRFCSLSCARKNRWIA